MYYYRDVKQNDLFILNKENTKKLYDIIKWVSLLRRPLEQIDFVSGFCPLLFFLWKLVVLDR